MPTYASTSQCQVIKNVLIHQLNVGITKANRSVWVPVVNVSHITYSHTIWMLLGTDYFFKLEQGPDSNSEVEQTTSSPNAVASFEFSRGKSFGHIFDNLAILRLWFTNFTRNGEFFWIARHLEIRTQDLVWRQHFQLRTSLCKWNIPIQLLVLDLMRLESLRIALDDAESEDYKEMCLSGAEATR